MDLNASKSLSALSSGTTRELPKKELGKDDFLRLLTTQLANQDPLKPVDNQAFIAQLAQFASVEQLNKVGSDLETLILAQASQNQLSVAGLVGKQVVFKSDGLDLAAGGTATTSAELAKSASLSAVIQDSTGRTVRSLQLGERPAGNVSIEWDGRDDAGTPAPAGHYTVVVTGKDSSGAAVSLTPRATGLVQGAAFGDSGPLLLVGGSRVKLSDVVEIHPG